MKNLLKFIILFLLLITTSTSTVYAKDPEPTVSADSAILLDGTTGEVIYGKNIDAAYPPASTTKIMTALLTLENCKLDDVVKVGKKPPFADGSKIYIFEGEELKVKDLLYALAIESANDCAEALAEHISGSVENFAVLMNKRAKELGCDHTNFVNPHGLFDKNHKTSSKDLALMMRELMKHPEYSEIAQTQAYLIPPTNKSTKERPLWNKNKLIQKNTASYYSGCEAGKTGYTIESQHSYVASATRNGQRLIVALVHDSKANFFQDATNLFNYGFKNYELVKLFAKGTPVTNYEIDSSTEIPLLPETDFFYLKEKVESEIPKYEVKNVDLSGKSFHSNDKITEAIVTFKNKQIGTVPLLSGVDREIKFSFKKPLQQSNKKLTFLYVGIGSVLLLVLCFGIVKKIKHSRRKNTMSTISTVYTKKEEMKNNRENRYKSSVYWVEDNLSSTENQDVLKDVTEEQIAITKESSTDKNK